MKGLFSTYKSATAKVTSSSSTVPSIHVEYANVSKPPSPPRSTARSPEHTRPNSPDTDDASAKCVANPPACYWIFPHANVAHDPQDKRPPKKAHPDFPAILVVRPDSDGYIVDVLTQTARSTLAVAHEEAKYSKVRSYKDFQAENLAKLLLIHYNKVLPGAVVDETAFSYDIRELEMEHRIKCCLIDCPKRHQAFMSALQALPVHKPQIAKVVDKLQNNAVLNLDHAVGHALRQYRQVSARVGVLYNGDHASNVLSDSLVKAWSSQASSSPQRFPHLLLDNGKKAEIQLTQAVTHYCTFEKGMLQTKPYIQLASWTFTPEQQQVWHEPLTRCFFNTIKPAYIQKYWIDYEHILQFTRPEDALALIRRLDDVAVLRAFANFSEDRKTIEEAISTARAKWELLYPRLATPMTDAVNQHFDTTTLPQIFNLFTTYFSNLKVNVTTLLAAAQRVPDSPLVEALKSLQAKMQSVEAKKVELSELQVLASIFGGQPQVSRHGIQNHPHIDASLIVLPQTALKLKNKPQTMLLFGPRLIVVEEALLACDKPVKTVIEIKSALQKLEKSTISVSRSWDVRDIALSVVASVNEGTDSTVLEITHKSYDTFEYRIEKGQIEHFMGQFDAVQAGFVYTKATGADAGASAHVKIEIQSPDAVANLFVGAVEGVRNAQDMSGMFDHLVYCYELGEADQKWTPAMCASMSTVLPKSNGQTHEGYVVTSHFLQQSGRSRQPTCIRALVETIPEAAACLHRQISSYNCIYNATYSSPNARIRSEAIRSRLLSESAMSQVSSGKFLVLKRKHIPGGTCDTASTSSIIKMQPSMMQVLARSTIRPIVESVRGSVKETVSQAQTESSSPLKSGMSPMKMQAMFNSRGKVGTFGAGFGRPGSIAGSLNSIGSRLTTVGRMVMGKDNQLQGPTTLQSVLFSACTYFMDLIISGVNLSMVPVTGAANASLDVSAPIGSSSKTQKVRWTMVHEPLLNDLRKSGKFKPDLARTMFPMAVFNALAEYFSGVDAVISISQFYALLDNVQAAVRTWVNFHNEIQPVINMLLDPIKDGAINGQPTPSNMLKNENLRLFLFIVYLFEFSRIQFTDKLHLCFPQPTSSEPFQQLMATKISTSTFVMAALLKGSVGSSNRPADVALARKLVVGVAAPAIADKLKLESKNKRIIGSPRALMDKLADMEKRVLSRITPKGEKGSLRSVMQMSEAAEEWRRWIEARNMEARAKAAAAAKATASAVTAVSPAANKSVPSSPKATSPLAPDVLKGLTEVDSGLATLTRPQAADISAKPQEQVPVKCALPLSRTVSDAAVELRHASSSEATVTDPHNQLTTLATGKVIESMVAAIGNLSSVEPGQ